MMTDEQVKKALAECTTLRYKVGGCKQCPYDDDCNNGTQDQLLKDAHALINQSEKKIAKLEDEVYRRGSIIADLSASISEYESELSLR